ncbi:hypothetical protein GcC1_042024 [Golovinomyces cichoracearum]|uniref:Uncharacterized protein n=1 Tax=Golovinomyces cichoracearum TaxID=62708 RepID=A0A420IZ39_9PEZI|nr:hypothetical protein GcC1_042024 [Golovinomyces cichoracearum]
MKSPGPESTITDSPSPEVSFTNPVSTQCTSLLPIEVCHSPQSISTANDIPIYEELQTSSPPAQTTQLKLTHPSLAGRQIPAIRKKNLETNMRHQIWSKPTNN